MNDAPTQVVSLASLKAKAATIPSAPCYRLQPATRLTQAHVELSRTPALATVARASLDALALELGQLFSTPVTCSSRLLDASTEPFAHLARNAQFLVLHLGAVDAMAVVELDSALVAMIVKYAAGSTELAVSVTKLTRVEEAALGWVALSALASLRREEQLERRIGPRLIGLFPERTAAIQQLDGRVRHVTIEIAVTAGGRTGIARFLMPSTALVSALRGSPEPAPAPLDGRLASASLAARCVVGLVLLERADATVLTAGDVVLFPQLRFDEGVLSGRTRIVTPAFELRGESSPAGFTLTRIRTTAPTKENPMSSDETVLPVEVEIELARVRLPITQLGTLAPGHVMALKLDATGPVTLRVGDQAFARAELVEIEGSVGARIIELL